MIKQTMKDRHFKELLTSVNQMGKYLKGEKVVGIKVTMKIVGTRSVKRLSQA